MTGEKRTKRKKVVAVKQQKGFVRILYIIKNMNWKGWVLFGVALAIIAAAIVLPIVLISGGGSQAAVAAATASAEVSGISKSDEEPSPEPTEEETSEPIETTSPEPTVESTLEQGDESERVKALQEKLMELGYLDIDESTSYYGSSTQDAVSRFQRQHDIEQDGVAGQQTLLMLYSDDAQSYTLLQGTSGNDVDSLQRQLQRLGYLDKATGYYGTETIDAVKAFQERNDLVVDGKTGEQTLDVIYSPDAVASASVEQSERRRANILEMVEAAEEQLGKPYILGNEGPNSFDCSGLVYYCLKVAGSNRGRYNAQGYSQVTEWEKITSTSDFEIGDLLFFWNSSRTRIGHVGIYIGGGLMIDASSSNSKVVKRDCYWSSLAFARRPW